MSTLAPDARAQSVVVGSLVMFAIFVISFSSYQAFVVPNQNAQVEFNHYTEVRDDMQELRQAHLATVDDGEPRSPSVQLGTTYNERVLAVNPPNPQGTLRSEEVGEFRLQDAPGLESGANIDTEDVCGTNRPESKAVRYEPSYARLSDAEAGPIVYESTVLYRETGDGDVILDSDQLVIQGSRINLVPLRSELAQSGRSTSFGMSSNGYGVEKRLQSGATPTVVIPTSLSASDWEELLASENVDSVSDHPEGVEVTLGADAWRVRCAVTSDAEAPSVVPPEPESTSLAFGQGGVTDYSAGNTEDTVTVANGLWTNIDKIAEMRLGGSRTTSLSGDDDVNSGEGVVAEFKIEDGTDDDVTFAKVAVSKDSSGQFQDRLVQLSDSPDNNEQTATLTADAAERILDGGQTDVLSVDSYTKTSFDRSDGNFGGYVETIEQMEDATIQTVDIRGRLGVEIVSGQVDLEIDADDRSQSYVYKSTDEIEFEVTAEGEADGQDVDLEIKDSGGQEVDSAKPRADRETLDFDGTKTFTLTWTPDWDDLSSGETYEAVVTSEDDEEVATVTIAQEDNPYFDVEIDGTNSPVDYSDELLVNITVENIGDASGQPQPQVSVADQDGDSQSGDTLAPGESQTFNISYDTSNIDTSNTGELTLTATTDDEQAERTVRVENPDIIRNPDADDLSTNESSTAQNISFELGKDLDAGNDQIRIDVTDTADDVSYDTSDSSWNVVSGDGSVSNVNSNNGRVQSVTYDVEGDDDSGDEITIEADNVNTSAADAGNSYTVEYRVESANDYPEGSNGDTDTTSFSTD